MSVCLLVVTDGRRSCAARSIPSALSNLRGPITEYVICDDSADPDYQSWLNRTFPEFTVICGNERRGFGGNIQRAWNYLRGNSKAEYVFHAEDDFTYNRPVDLTELITILDARPYLVQLALRRQPWNYRERQAGGVVERYPLAYEEMKDGEHTWLEHRLFYTTNPSLYRMQLCYEIWPDDLHSEGHFTHQLLGDPRIRFGYWGARDSGEWVTHIGTVRAGAGY